MREQRNASMKGNVAATMSLHSRVPVSACIPLLFPAQYTWCWPVKFKDGLKHRYSFAGLE